MKFSIYLISALLLVSCALGGESSHHHPHHHKKDRMDDLTAQALDFGINFIFDQAADTYGVSSDNVEVTHVKWEKIPLDGPITLFKFDADATNSDDATIEAWFGVEYNHETEEMTMGKWKYDIHFLNSFNEENNEFEEEDGSVGEVQVESDAELEIEGENEIEIETGVDEEGTDDNNEDFEEVPEEEIDNALEISEVLQFGAAFIFDRAADRFGVSNSDVQITDVESVFRRSTEDNRTVYRINIDATNNDDATVEARLTIEHDNETGENVVGPWRYSIRYQTFNDEEGGLFEEDILEFDMNDGLADIL